MKEFPSGDAAEVALEKSVAEKLKKGYVQGGEPSRAQSEHEAEARTWFGNYGFVRYVDSGDEENLEEISSAQIWTHYSLGLNGEFVTNGFLPEYDEVHGYYVMRNEWKMAENSEFIQVLEHVTDCEMCEDGYDSDGMHCTTCNGGEIDYLATDGD